MTTRAPRHPTLPFETGPDPLTMGLRPIPRDEALAPDDGYGTQMAERLRLLDTRREAVFGALPAAAAASAGLLDHLAEMLPRRHPGHFARDGAALCNLVTGERCDPRTAAAHPLERAGRLVQDDLLLLTPSGVLEAAVLCFPSRWRLADKLGHALPTIHAPVPGYQERLALPVDRLFARLVPGRTVERHNWSVLDDAALFQPEARGGRPLAGDAGSVLVLRTERQTLTRLATHVLFTIRVRVAPLGRAIPDAAAAAALAAAVRALPPAMVAYKGLSALAGPLLEWLDARAAMTQA